MTEPIDLSEYEVERKRKRKTELHIGAIIALLFGGVLWIASLGGTGKAVFVNVVAQLILWSALAAFALSRRPAWRQLGRIPFIVAALWIVGCNVQWRFETYDIHWRNDNGTSFTDSYRRHSDRLVYRRFRNDEVWMDGPMAGEGQKPVPHGHWSVMDLGKDRDLLNMFSDKWYWYGEEINEGEWNLRNR